MTTTPQIYELKHIPAGTYTDQNGHTSNIYDSVYVQTMPTGTVCVTVQRQTPDLGIFNEDFDLMLTPAMAEELGTQIIVAARRNPYAITRQETP